MKAVNRLFLVGFFGGVVMVTIPFLFSSQFQGASNAPYGYIYIFGGIFIIGGSICFYIVASIVVALFFKPKEGK